MRLVLFFTKGMSLDLWMKTGLFDREVALYERLTEKGVKISFLTYGNSSEIRFKNRLPGINILYNRWRLPKFLYSIFLHHLHRSSLKSCDLIKTNQMKGADLALRCADYWDKPLICRMGYMWSEFVNYDNGSSDKEMLIENKLFRSSQSITVTTDEMKKKILNRIPRLSKKIFVIPNYVDTTSFCPNPSIKKEFDILFVGRLVEQKNIIGLLDSISVLNVKVMIVGAGELDSLIKNELKKSNCKISWLQNISNNSLPSLMNRSSIFILPSHYEGHPKTIIEAMACGMPVIGANSPGIKEIINHGHNGYLCETNSDSIKSAIEALLINPSMCQFLGKNARKYTVEKFSLDKIAKVEYEQYKTVLQN